MSAKQVDAKQSLAFFSGAHFSSQKSKFERTTNDEGHPVLRVTDMPVFRSGQFRDSMGWDHEYDAFHMDQMVSNFGILSDRAILQNLPVRAGHPSPFTNYMHEMIGHVSSLRTEDAVSPADGETYTYLLATFDVFDESAAEKIEKGLWVNRSAEVGMYETNSGMGFYPTLMGFAYVDIPAVEGLNFSRMQGYNSSFVVACDEEIKEEVSVAGTNNQGAAAPFEFSLRSGKTTDFAAVQAHIASIEGENDTLKASNESLTTENTGLKQYEADQKKAGRESLVDSLITDKKVLASQKEALYGFVGSLSDEQFLAYSNTMSEAPALSVLGQQATTTEAAGTPNPGEGDAGEEPEIVQARKNYQRHLMSGMSADKAAATQSGKLLKSKGLI